MKTKATIIPAAIVAAIALNFTSTSAEAGHGDDLSRYAHRIDEVAHELEDEFRLHYKHLSAYGHLRSDIAAITRKVHHIDGLTHDPHTSLRHINADLTELDRLAHHMHEVVDRAESGRCGGHAHGDTRHVHSLLASLNRSIHSMQAVTRRMAHSDHYDRHGHGSSHRSDRHAYGRDRYHGRTYSRSDAAAEVLRFVIERNRGWSRH